MIDYVNGLTKTLHLVSDQAQMIPVASDRSAELLIFVNEYNKHINEITQNASCKK